MSTRLFGPDGRSAADVVTADPVAFTFSITPQFVAATGLGLVRVSLGRKQDLDALATSVAARINDALWGEGLRGNGEEPQAPTPLVTELILDALRIVATPVSYLTPQQARVVGLGLVSTAEQATGLATMIRSFVDMGGMPIDEAVGAAQALLSGVRDEHRAYEEYVQQERTRRAEAQQQEASNATPH